MSEPTVFCTLCGWTATMGANAHAAIIHHDEKVAVVPLFDRQFIVTVAANPAPAGLDVEETDLSALTAELREAQNHLAEAGWVTSALAVEEARGLLAARLSEGTERDAT